jgi:hypothetical protein
VDLFDESVAAGEHRLQSIFPRLDCSHEPVNVSTVKSPPLREVCAPEVWEELLRLNALDLELVERARTEVRRRLSIVPKPAPKSADSAQPLNVRQIFDSKYYLAANPDVRAARIDPLRHYLEYGSKEGRKPHPLFGNPHKLFDSESYVREYPEAAANGTNPLVHYLKCPKSEIDIGGAEAVRLNIDDVGVTVVFGPPPADPGQNAFVCKDASGRMQFRAPAQQRRFFESVGYDQLRAQLLRRE